MITYTKLGSLHVGRLGRGNAIVAHETDTMISFRFYQKAECETYVSFDKKHTKYWLKHVQAFVNPIAGFDRKTRRQINRKVRKNARRKISG